MSVQHFKDHFTLYAGITVAFWSYIVYTFLLRVRYFSVTRHYPGPGHGHWFFGQLGNITKKAPGVAQLDWHRKVSHSTLPSKSLTLILLSHCSMEMSFAFRVYYQAKNQFHSHHTRVSRLSW